MSEELIIKHCAPTLAGLKTGNIFICPCESKAKTHNQIRRLNRTLAKKDFAFCLLDSAKKMRSFILILYAHM